MMPLKLLRAGALVTFALLPSIGHAACTAAVGDDSLVAPGKLQLSINPTNPPQQFVDKDGQLQGLNVELARELGKRLCLPVELVRMDFPSMIPAMNAGRIDGLNTGMFWTEERSKLMYMIPYEQAAISFLAVKGNPLGLKTVDDLAGKRIAVELGGIEERRTREVNDIVTKKGLKPVNVMTFNNFAEAFQALKAGQSDAATCIDATAKFQEQRGDFTRAISGVFPQTACFALANKVAADAIVASLNELKKNGTYDKLLDQYGVLKIDEPTFSIKGPGPA
jgi:polar amino acid transport system substrate-binding protein